MPKLQGAKLKAVVSEVLDEAAAAELAAQKREVKRVVDQITSDIKHEHKVQQEHLEKATKATERMKALQDQLKRLKAGDQGALKLPESVSLSPTGRIVAYPERLYDMVIDREMGRFARTGRWTF